MIEETMQEQQINYNRHWHISKRTGLILLLLAGFTAYFVAVALMPQSPLKKTISAPTPTLAIPAVAKTILSFDPSQKTITKQGLSSSIQEANINIDTGTNKVTIVDIELAYDASILSNVDINPGTFFSNPVILAKDIDTKNGNISYMIGIQLQAQGAQGKGTIATLSYSISPTANQAKSTVLFLPKTLVGAQGINQTVLRSTTPLTIYLK